ETGVRRSRSAQPKPSAQTSPPSTPTATDSPGRFCSLTAARTDCRALSVAAAQGPDGAASVADGTAPGSGCHVGAVAVMYVWRPAMKASSTPTPTTSSASHVSVRFQLLKNSPREGAPEAYVRRRAASS